MIRNVVLDISNVMVDYDFKGFLAGKGFGTDMIKRLAKASIMSPYWDEFDKGLLTEEEAMNEFINIDPEIANELHIAFDSIEGMLLERDYAVEWVIDLKKRGYRVYYLSNYSKKAYTECNDTLEFTKYADGGILSFREGVIKPDPEIYNRLVERYNLIGEECVFIDDSAENVKTAVSLGWKGIVFESREQVEDELAKL